MGQMSVLCEEGDVKISWNSDNADEVKNAKDHFNKLKESGHMFFRLNKGAKGDKMDEFDGAAGELICEFDPKAEIVASPPPVGGCEVIEV